MKPIVYPPSALARLGRAAEQAADALARFDERLARIDPAIAEGARARADFLDAQAILHLQGRLAPLEDLVLHDAGMNAQPPTPELNTASAYLASRRALARRDPAATLSVDGLRQFLNLTPKADAAPPSARRAALRAPLPHNDEADEESDADDDDDDASDESPIDVDETSYTEIDQLLARSRRALSSFNDLTTQEGRARLRLSDPAYDAEQRVDAWLASIDELAREPAITIAAAALDAWLTLEPSEHQPALGFPLAAMTLRRAGRARAHLPAFALGLRDGKFRWRPSDPVETRLSGLIAAIETAARAGVADLDRLTVARAAMLQRTASSRKTSRLSELIDLFVASPLVTVALAAKRLDASPQAVEAWFRQLGGALPRELTGRRRYRAWGVL